MIYFVLTIGIVVIDQISKYYAQTLLQGGPSVPLIKNIFHLTYARNTGAAFSILEGNQFILKGVTTLIMIFLVGYLYKVTKEKGQILFKISLAFILGGGIGNLIDRIRLEYVIDYFDFTLINFAIFNVADSFVVVGTILLGYLLVSNKIEL
jgi:signal peptidase II